VNTKNKGIASIRIAPKGAVAAQLKKRFFTTTQVAARWKVSSITVIRLIEEGQLKGLKIRRMYRVDMESVESYEKKVSF